MDPGTRNFWLGATWFVGLAAAIALIVLAIMAVDRWTDFDHVHDHAHPAHEHPHEHPPHNHPHPWPEHSHEHTHSITGEAQ